MTIREVPPGNSDIPTHRLKAGCSASELRGRMPTEKRCGTCQESKPLTDFNRKSARADGLQEVCRECNGASSRKYYRDNREHHIRVIRQRSDARRFASRRFIGAHLREHPCVDCGVADLPRDRHLRTHASYVAHGCGHRISVARRTRTARMPRPTSAARSRCAGSRVDDRTHSPAAPRDRVGGCQRALPRRTRLDGEDDE